MEARRREKDEQHLYLTAKIITDDSFARHSGFDLASFDEKNLPATDLAAFRVLKTETFATFKSRIAAYHKINERDFRLWVLVNRQNKTVRPDVPILEENNNQSEYYQQIFKARTDHQQWTISETTWPPERMTSGFTSTTTPMSRSSMHYMPIPTTLPS
jgi:ubiquitin carboxyl-terminal hydrolase 7